MDKASLIGIALGIGLVATSMLLGGASATAFLDVRSILIVFGGATAAVCVCFPLRSIVRVPLIVKKVFFNQSQDLGELIEQIVNLAETARRDGLLALEGRMEEVDNAFIRLGVQMAVDGTRPEVIEDILRTEVDALSARHRDGKRMMEHMGRFAPAFGMIGTLIGLITMLGNMTDASSIGSGMAIALITTLYGAIAANVIFLPFAEKLGYANQQELIRLEIVIRGIMAIQSGENPRVVAQKLHTFLPPSARRSDRTAA